MAAKKTLEQRVGELEDAVTRIRRAAGQRFRRLEGEIEDAQRAAREAQTAADEARSSAEEALLEAQDD